MNTSISFYLNFMKFHISTPHNKVSENITRGRSPEKIVQIKKHIWLSWCWLREEKTHYLHYGNWMVFRLNKLESPSPKDALCQIWLKLAQRFWRRFLNFVNVLSLFRNYLPLEKVGALLLNKLESSSPENTLSQAWLKLAQPFWSRFFFKFRQCILAIS